MGKSIIEGFQEEAGLAPAWNGTIHLASVQGIGQDP